MKPIILVILVLALAASGQQQNKKPVIWLVGTSVGYGLVAVGTLIEPNINTAAAGCVTMGVCVPLMVVKYIRYERGLCLRKLKGVRDETLESTAQ